MTLDTIHGWLWWHVFWGWLLELQDPESREYLASSLETYGSMVDAGEFQEKWDQEVARHHKRVEQAGTLLDAAQARGRKAAPGQTALGEVSATG